MRGSDRRSTPRWTRWLGSLPSSPGKVRLIDAAADSVLVLEMSEQLLRQAGASAGMIEELLRGHGYNLNRVSNDGLLTWKVVGQDESVDCVAVPEECQEFAEIKNWGLA